jgi:hypothetical protein
LDLVESLLDELTILDVQNSIRVALNIWVVRDHDAGGSGLLAFALGTDPVNVQNQVHDCN